MFKIAEISYATDVLYPTYKKKITVTYKLGGESVAASDKPSHDGEPSYGTLPKPCPTPSSPYVYRRRSDK